VEAIVSPSGELRIHFDHLRCPVPDLVRRLDKLGLRARTSVPAPTTIAPPPSPSLARRKNIWRWFWENPVLSLPLLGGAMLAIAQLGHLRAMPRSLELVLYTLSFVLSSYYTAPKVIEALRSFRFDVDVLMFAAAAGACALGKFDEAALLLFLFGVGSAGETLALGRARQAIEALARLAPETATVRDPDGRERVVRVEQLRPGDIVVIRASERIPADGVVIAGASTVDQSAITGESIPVEKAPGSELLAGTINGNGAMFMSVERAARESTLARIIGLVEAAQASKAPTELLTERIERRYVPAILITTVALMALPLLLADELWAKWFYRAMAFLTAASPCALAIGTPAAVLSGIARAARGGVLVKGGAHLETLGRVRAIAFDKTGTLTEGRAILTDVVPLGEWTRPEALRLAASVEKSSTHPLAVAIVAAAEAEGLHVVRADQVEQRPGLGVTGVVAGRQVAVGHPHRVAQQVASAAIAARLQDLEAAGRTAVLCAVDGEPAALFGITDRPRATAREVIDALRAADVQEVAMLTGDNARAAEAVANEIGVDSFHAGLLPSDKLARLRDLRAQHGRVAMVGDGVNDAPALAAADVGIAMGGAGAHVALETADVVLMTDDLTRLPEAIGLARFSRRIILQNLVIALGVIAVLAPTAALGGATLGVAVVFHEGSTVLVVLNALRLLAYRGDGRRSRVQGRRSGAG
jgi:Cd2+/Zn2+-exporting ATPase